MSTKKTTVKQMLRDIFGFSLYKIAKDTGIPYPQLIRWNTGSLQRMHIETLRKLAELKKVTPAKFFEIYLAELEAAKK